MRSFLIIQRRIDVWLIYIYITKEEYDAISFCSEEITSLVEGGAEDEYVKEADNALRSIASIQRKYRKALKRENALQDAKAAVKKLHPELKGEFYDKLVKNVVEQLINGGKNGKDQENEEGCRRNGQASWHTDRQRPAAFPQRITQQVTIYQ
nr:MAG TPA: hypothetical protein [Caudoviricetes sp.]